MLLIKLKSEKSYFLLIIPKALCKRWRRIINRMIQIKESLNMERNQEGPILQILLWLVFNLQWDCSCETELTGSDLKSPNCIFPKKRGGLKSRPNVSLCLAMSENQRQQPLSLKDSHHSRRLQFDLLGLILNAASGNFWLLHFLLDLLPTKYGEPIQVTMLKGSQEARIPKHFLYTKQHHLWLGSLLSVQNMSRQSNQLCFLYATLPGAAIVTVRVLEAAWG